MLAVTGAEALYADMGHFGRSPITRIWLFLVFPACVLNYMGQGALILGDPKGAIGNPFFLLAPGWAQVPLVFLAAAATVIASQAVISGAFSVTQQAARLGYLPRLRITHTSERRVGQIYVPWINWALLVAVLTLVVTFKTSNALAFAYGVAVTGTITITTLLFFYLVRTALAKAAVDRRPGRRCARRLRPAVPRGERDQDPARRLAPDRDRGRGLHRPHDMAEGTRARDRAAEPRRGAAPRLHPRSSTSSTRRYLGSPEPPSS